MRREKTGTISPPDPGIYEYGEGTAKTDKKDGQTASETGAISPKGVPRHESGMREEYDKSEDIESLDAIDMSEPMEFMEADDLVETIPQSSEEDEDSENVQRLYMNPRHIAPKAKKPRYMPKRTIASEETREKTRVIKSRWLITSCRSCGDIIRFRANQPVPLTCGKPQCIERFEERNKSGGA